MQPNPSSTWTSRAAAFGAVLKQERMARGLSQLAVAQLAGIRPSAGSSVISEIEHGKRKPSRAQLDRLCAHLGLDRDAMHALLGLIPTDIELAWLNCADVRHHVRGVLTATQEIGDA